MLSLWLPAEIHNYVANNQAHIMNDVMFGDIVTFGVQKTCANAWKSAHVDHCFFTTQFLQLHIGLK